ncbi:hypothetical protein [Candidatus Electronema sp. PJ]|uniref:hypothetical protein n=1 Tax=Candidatus Electronema sp. PJ TaxID=3401572 RepID=UPI003AA8703D
MPYLRADRIRYLSMVLGKRSQTAVHAAFCEAAAETQLKFYSVGKQFGLATKEFCRLGEEFGQATKNCKQLLDVAKEHLHV